MNEQGQVVYRAERPAPVDYPLFGDERLKAGARRNFEISEPREFVGAWKFGCGQRPPWFRNSKALRLMEAVLLSDMDVRDQTSRARVCQRRDGKAQIQAVQNESAA